ncbi:MAG: hypothetical protein F6K10_27190 [Moorea sp. SIO2B7]|nr:hypothetical protein [Moorena sp. SIO2B7]
MSNIAYPFKAIGMLAIGNSDAVAHGSNPLRFALHPDSRFPIPDSRLPIG